jgi:hypothetical protein
VGSAPLFQSRVRSQLGQALTGALNLSPQGLSSNASRFATCRERVRREAPYTSEGMCPHSTCSSKITSYLRTKRRESAAQRKPTC